MPQNKAQRVAAPVVVTDSVVRPLEPSLAEVTPPQGQPHSTSSGMRTSPSRPEQTPNTNVGVVAEVASSGIKRQLPGTIGTLGGSGRR